MNPIAVDEILDLYEYEKVRETILEAGQEFGLEPAQKGLLVAVPVLSGAALRLVMGPAGDRFGAKRVGMAGTSAIVGGAVPIATGAALAAQMKPDDRVVAVFFGDAATEDKIATRFQRAGLLGSAWSREILAHVINHLNQRLRDRVPDLILTSSLLSPRDETALDKHLRKLGVAAAHVQTLTIPVMATAAASKKKPAGVLAKLRRGKAPSAKPSGCDPEVFASEVRGYLERAVEHTDDDGHIGMLLHRSVDLLGTVALTAKPEPRAFGRSIARLDLESEYAEIGPPAGPLAEALGEDGLAAYWSALEAEWAKLEALRPAERGDQRRVDDAGVRRWQLRERLIARARGRLTCRS